MSPTKRQLRLARESMRGSHEAIPEGVPHEFDWREKPVLHAGLKAPAGMAALTGWGQCFVGQGAESKSAAISVIWQETWVRTRDKAWVRLQAGGVEGAVYRADYDENLTVGAWRRGGQYDGTEIESGEAAHWWPYPRTLLPKDMTALVTWFAAKASKPRTLLAGGGADYWANVSAPWAADGVSNPPIGAGKLRWMSTRWATYAMGVFTDLG
jgi:hypothetical protein